jgi:hypothetical protein
MPGDPQLFAFALKIVLTAAIVVAAATASERAGPLLGALILTLPIGAGPSYVFLALQHDPDFIAASALVSRFRSSLSFAARSDANFGIEGH